MATEILNEKDVLELLRNEVDRAGSQSAWARKHKYDRTVLSEILSGRRPVTPRIKKELKLKTVYIRET